MDLTTLTSIHYLRADSKNLDLNLDGITDKRHMI